MTIDEAVQCRFNEGDYLVANLDVARAVASGRFSSGWQHFLQCGYRERRPASPILDEIEIGWFEGLEAQRYWDDRKSSVYLQHLKALVSFIGRDAKSVIDVGSNGCPYLEWFPWIKHRVSLDLNTPYRATGVKSIKEDLLHYLPDVVFDLCTCFQVLEHVPNAGAFAQRLLALSPRVLISVPYRWPINAQTRTMGHIHDPVDEEKCASWFGRAPSFQMISQEVSPPIERLICYYELGR